MKKITLTLFFAVFALLFVACERDITEPTISANPSKPAQSDLSLTVDFTKANAESPIAFSWSAADFGFASSTTYTLQLSSKNDFSADVVNLLSTQSLSGTSSVKQINNVLLSWGKTAGTETDLYYRVAASVAAANVVYSEVKSKKLTPFKLQLEPDQYTLIYVPGAYQGWSPGADNGRLYSYNADSKYEGIVRIKDGTNATSEFKITSAPDWSHTNWGGTLTKSGNNYSGTLDPSGNNFSVAAGVYLINVDTSTLAITLTKTDDWGIIGSATADGWNSDMNLFYDGKYKVWQITADFTAGEIKFRANDDWGLNYGDNGADGSLEAGGANIALATAGNYTIKLDVENKTYTVKKN